MKKAEVKQWIKDHKSEDNGMTVGELKEKLKDIPDNLNILAEGKETLYEIIKVLEQETWIPVRERLPEDGKTVLFCDIDDDIMIGYHVQGRPDTHFSQDGTWEDIKNVIAWMPLPFPPRLSHSNVCCRK